MNPNINLPNSIFNFTSDCLKIIPQCHHRCKDCGKLATDKLFHPIKYLFIAGISLIVIFKIYSLVIYCHLRKKEKKYLNINHDESLSLLPGKIPLKERVKKFDKHVPSFVMVATMVCVIIFSQLLINSFEDGSTCDSFSTGCYHFCIDWLGSIMNDTNSSTGLLLEHKANLNL